MPLYPPFRSTLPRHGRRVGLLSTYPPELCGLATFAAALEAGLRRGGHRVDMVRITDGRNGSMASSATAGELVNGDPSSLRQVALLLSQSEVAIIQHEYGIFGGRDGDEVVELLRLIDVPTIVTLHTVPLHPTAHQQSLLVEIVGLAHRVVVMTAAAGERLVSRYPIDPRKVTTIPHGAATPAPGSVASDEGAHGERPQLLTWGLLGPGKGIEHAIDALALLADIRPRIRYTVAGVTHPKVFANDGDRYRSSLVGRSRDCGLGRTVTFDDSYRDLPQLTRFVASAAAVVLPYDSRDQVTSGVLVDAIAAGRPVVATAFPHAVELLRTGAGIVVPHADPVAMAAAIRLVVTDCDAAEAMAAEARRIAPSLSWAAVAGQYALVADELVQAVEALAM